MKKLLSAALLASALSPITQADTVLGVYAGAGIWNADYSGDTGSVRVDLDDLGLDDEDNNFFYVALEHPIPLVPNIKLQHTDISSKETANVTTSFRIDNVTFAANQSVTTDLDLSHTDAILYYEILDNWLNLDLGLNLRVFDGSVKINSASQTETVDLDGVLPMLYTRAQIDLPFTGWSIGADANLISFSGNSVTDYSARIAYSTDGWVMDLGFELGYRSMALELDDVDDLETDLTLDGPYAAVTVHF